ncbi:uncharacterized protein AB675_11447 [Cyphellophora attinorum]|uniref:Uncharacterized protein n=1 Tax=Cyphellophora attinorum TaxID=1664694 RepID=A0A0N1HQC2_9EURO|nr:uncharacterized protein AB675_11447 [Phialophora attinorum]KPI40127.1 hypothetical protein AB675_11447 [Phialophora attinorum]
MTSKRKAENAPSSPFVGSKRQKHGSPNSLALAPEPQPASISVERADSPAILQSEPASTSVPPAASPAIHRSELATTVVESAASPARSQTVRIVESEPMLDTRPRGTLSLYDTCLERTANVMINEPASYDMISTLPTTIQQDLWSLLLDDRRERQTTGKVIEQIKAALPLADWDKATRYDDNVNFIEAYPQSFDEAERGDAPYETMVRHWRRFWDSVNNLQRDSVFKDPGRDVHLVENSLDSVVRYSICASKTTADSRGLQRPSNCSHIQHFLLRDLTSPELLKERMKALEDLPGCVYDSQEVPPDENGFGEIGDNFDDLECRDFKVSIMDGISINCYFTGNMYSRRNAEVHLNALLSPLEMVYGRPWYKRALEGRQYAFVVRYGKLLDDAAVS